MIRRPKTSTLLILGLLLLIIANEVQRVNAQWLSHRERQQQLLIAASNGLKLDVVIRQNDLQLQMMRALPMSSDRLRPGSGAREGTRLRAALPR